MPTEINFYPLDVADSSEGILVFGYTPEKKKIAVIDASYFPWFYIEKEKAGELKSLCEFAKVRPKHLQDEGNLIKVFFAVSDFAAIVRMAKKKLPLYNADVPIRKRWWIDRKIEPFTLTKVIGEQVSKPLAVDIVISAELIRSLNTPLKKADVLAFDLETSCAGSSPDPGKDAIISAALYADDFKKVLTWKRFPEAPDYVSFVSSEAELIEEFCRIVNELKPHIIAGYGSNNFDIPYLIERAAKYKIKLGLCWDGSDLFVKRVGRKSVRIIGLQHCDASYFIRSILSIDTAHYKLDEVAKKMLGKGKLTSLGPKKINELWAVGLPQELALLAEYNLTDAQLAQELAKKILPVQLELCKLTGQSLYDINLATYGFLVEWYIIKNGLVPIPLLPSSKEIFERQKKSYTGGFVVEPKPGLYKEICAIDFRSLYPSIIVSHNISPETKNCSCCKIKGKVEVRDQAMWFCSKKTGFIPELVKGLVERRQRINGILRQTNPQDPAFRELMARQHALKYIAAAFYGYLGFPGSRFYSYDCARAVTSLGRKYIQLVIKEADKFGFKILYGDTDGLFVELKEGKDIKNFLKIINAVLPQPMELELRARYKAGLFLEKKSGEGGAKKRYALMSANGSLVLRGLEAVRGDWSALAKDTQREVLRILLAEQNAERAVKYLEQQIKNVEQRRVRLQDLSIQVRLTKPLEAYDANSPHVAAARKAKEKGYPVRRGYVVSYVRVPGPEKLKLTEDASLEDYDVKYYIENQLLRATYKIFELFGYGPEKLKAGQTTLEGYES